jgi:hypothetical protein
MKDITRKSFIEMLFGTTAAVAVGSAITLPAPKKPEIDPNLFYRPYIKALGGYLASMRGDELVECLTIAFTSAKEKGNLEYQIEHIPQYGEIAFEVYTSQKMLPEEKIDRIEVTEDWLRKFCNRHGIC